MALSIFVPIVLLVSILMITGVIVAAIKTSKPEGGNSVIKNVYIYLVLFATLMMTIGGSVAAFMAVADIIAPAPYYQTFEEYKRWGMERTDLKDTEIAQLSEEELKIRYEAMVTAETERQIIRAKNNLIKSLGWIIIPLPIFIYYQRRLKDREA
ncbi:MAG: hypothetical protein ACOX6F_07960 [Syntrophomonadaceae bacterium]|jgi:hypothetical protein|nr:hypothetical protein [Bacillota bacterium]NLM89521.1 hypothetical protein [Syntrophomonadaceae bacterium]HAA08331.1 hypothetical protein [Syntrophomonas sp.]HQA50397.1 hypothetical protein [Syntrophomonadaceae bacterium]HQD91319.1 hypothetical protein [Syntrophomonadaceae bacterium]